MPFIHLAGLETIERLPGWLGRFFHSDSMTFAHYEFRRGAAIHEHFHPEEEVYQVIEGQLEITVEGETRTIDRATAAIVPANARHSVKALTDGRVIIVDQPRRRDIGG